MENLDKKIDLKVTMGLRNEFLCKKCDIFPRPDLKLMRCSSCTALLCQNCCEDEDDFEGQLAGEIDLLTKCPLCHRKSKDAKILIHCMPYTYKTRDITIRMMSDLCESGSFSMRLDHILRHYISA